MGKNIKHLLCFSFAVVLLLAVQACKKNEPEHNFRDAIAGMYTGDFFDLTNTGSYYFQGHGTVRVSPMSGDPMAISVNGNVFSNMTYRDSSTIRYSGSTVADFSRDSAGHWHLYYMFNLVSSAIHPEYTEIHADKVQ